MSASFKFPEKTITEAEKNKNGGKWYEDFIIAIMGNTLNQSFYLSRQGIIENRDFFNGTIDGDEFNFIRQSENQKSLPAIWIHYMKIRNKVNLMQGELKKRGYDIYVKAINAEASAEQFRFRQAALYRMAAKPHNDELAQISGMNFDVLTNVPGSPQELDEWMKENYKTTSARIMEYIARYNYELYKWKSMRIELFRDILITNRCFVKSEIRNGYPQPRRIDPLDMVFDVEGGDDFLSRSTYGGEVQYIGMDAVVEEFNLNEKEAKDLVKYSQGPATLRWAGITVNSARAFSPYNSYNNQQKVLVFKAQWLDYKYVQAKITFDKHGNEHVHLDYSGKERLKINNAEKKMGGKIERRRIQTVREATLIGGHLLKQWGEKKNIIRDHSNPAVSFLDYVCLIPNYTNYNGVSMVDTMKGIEKLRNIIMFKIQLEVVTAGKKGFAYNAKFIPKKWSDNFEEMMYFQKISGVTLFEDDSEYTTNKPPIIPYDSSLGRNIEYFIQLTEYLDKELDEVSGVSQARQGQSTGANQGLGVTQSQVFQSALSTEIIYELFTQFEERVWNLNISQCKIAWSNKEKFAMILGDSNIDFITQDIDLQLDDYATFLEVLPGFLQEENELKQFISEAWQSQSITLSERGKLLEMILNKDKRAAIRQLIRWAESREKLQMQMEQQKQQAAAQLQQQIEGSKTQRESGLLDQEIQGNLAEEKVKAERNIDLYNRKKAGDEETQLKEHQFKLFEDTLKEKSEARKGALA